MSDLISKAKVLETYATLYDIFDDSEGIIRELHKVYDLINAIQPERKTGRWTKAYDGNDDHVKCTGCFKTYDWISQAQYYNYCPNCGAYMGGDADGDMPD